MKGKPGPCPASTLSTIKQRPAAGAARQFPEAIIARLVPVQQRQSAAKLTPEPSKRLLRCHGSWTLGQLQDVERQLARLSLSTGAWALDTAAVGALDSAGALLLDDSVRRFAAQGVDISVERLQTEHQELLELVRIQSSGMPAPPAPLNSVERLGRATVRLLQQAWQLLEFVGDWALQAVPLLARPQRIRWSQVVMEIRRAGVMALPIVGLLIFLLGVVIAYQGGAPLQRYGATIFIVELVAVTMLREMAPLITAIIVAGRTGSSYAAEIGTMQVTEEVDALRTMGITPFEMLVLPRLLALLVALPLLTVFADIMGLLGGMLAADSLFGIGWPTFLDRMPRQLPASTFWVGIVKAPVFAVIIALVGCFQGLRVRGSAEAVGRATTASVVIGIFLVIVTDAIFSIAFNLLDL